MAAVIEKADKKPEFLALKISPTLKTAIERLVEKDTHSTLSEFARQALREKVEREAQKLGVKLEDLYGKEWAEE